MIYSPAFFKPCSKCGEWFPGTSQFFGVDKRGKMGLAAECRTCHNKRCKIYDQKRSVYFRDYQRNLPKEIKNQRSAEWRQRNPEKAREVWHRQHVKRKDQEREYNRAKYWSNPDYYRRRAKEYAKQKRAERPLPKQRIKVTSWSALLRHRARKCGKGDTLTAADLRRALAYWGECCAVCGRPAGIWHTIAADHWIPLNNPNSPGTVPENIIPLCHGQDGCNNSKSDRDPVEWLTEKLGKRKARRKLAEIAAYFAWVKSQK